MEASELKARLKRRQPVIGTWSHIPNLQVVEIIAACGLDFVVFDMEHGPHSHADMPALYCAAEAHGMAPITRVSGPDNSNVLRALDSGAKGIMVPHVDGLAMAERCLESMYYGTGPHSRGVATLTRASLFDQAREADHFATQNALVTSVLMVEDRAGLDALDAICALPRLDVVFVGIYDLAQSLGMPGGLKDPAFRALFEDAVARILDRGVAVGCYAPDAAAARELIEMGIAFVTISVDGAMLRQSYERVMAELGRDR